MKERPILMRDNLVLASLAGTKTQTRRPIIPQPTQSEYEPELLYYQERTKKRIIASSGTVIPKGTWSYHTTTITEFAKKCPWGVPGDRLWVREAFDTIMAQTPRDHEVLAYDYRAGHHKESHQWRMMDIHGWRRWTPSIHMPRKACRLVLDIIRVRVQRLQDITNEEAAAEGVMAWAATQDSPVRDIPGGEERLVFIQLWESIYGPGSWEANPLVWVLEYRQA